MSAREARRRWLKMCQHTLNLTAFVPNAFVSFSYRPGLIPLTPVPSLPGGFGPAADFIITSISLPTASLTDTARAGARRVGHARATWCCSCRASAAQASRALTRKGQLARTGEKLRFRVGVCGQYKPAPVETVRTYALITKYAVDDVRAAKEREMASWDADPDNAEYDFSSSETLLDTQLLRLVWIRRTFNVGQAGAEVMQRGGARSGGAGQAPINEPYTAFCYLVQRLTLYTRYCIVYHEKLTAEFKALKPMPMAALLPAAATPAAPLPKKGLDGLVEFDVVRAAVRSFNPTRLAQAAAEDSRIILIVS
ncbi:hypothetical protein C8J57DRAFT_1258330 [Mycena rebaudengoi]|nr:hypothetical protein C8J57DRAFT_1258330 [Mycena rebaudengoi]